MNQTLIRSSCRSFCALAIALSAACAPSEEGKIPCDDTSNCPSDFPTCSTSKFCVAFSPAVKLVAVTGDGQSAAVAGSPLPAALVVSAQDVNGNGVPGVAVTWAVTAGAGSITASSTTGADGTASVTPTLGNTVATNTFTATASGLTPGTVTFNELSIAGPTTSFVVSFPANIGVQIPGTATVTAKDKNNNSSNYTGHVTVTLGKPDSAATLPVAFALTTTSTTPGTIPGILFGKAATGQTVIVTDTTTASITGTSNTFNVAAGTTTTVVTSNHLTAVFGQSVTFTAVVTPGTTGAVLPSGTVTFFSDTVSIGTGTLVGSQATFSTSALAVGTHSITAQYGGDTGFAGSTSAAITQIVNQANTTVTLASSLSTSTFGQSVTFTATVAVTSPGAGTPTGTVAFRDAATNIVTCATQALSGLIATCTVSTLSAGSHPITAVYNGDTNFAASPASNTVTQTVNKAATTVTVALTTGPNPSVFGQAVTFTATVAVTSPGAGTPTGSVAFKDGGTNIATCATQAVTGTTATCTVSSLAVATHSITATYIGDTNFSPSPASAAISQVVNKADTAVTLGSNANPSVFGQPVTFTATVAVTAPGAGTPTGNVTFRDNGTNISGCASQAVSGTTTITATCTLSSLSVGTHPITATYNGDASFNASSTSNTVSQVVNKGDVTVSLGATPNPSTFGQSVTFTATLAVTAPAVGTPTGNVTFRDNGTNIAGCTAQTVSGALTATCTLSTLAVGTHPVTATYNGDGNFNASSSSNTVNQVVNKANTTTSVVSDSAPSTFGQTVTFTATIATSPAGGSATGTVAFNDGATAIAGCAAQTVTSNTATCAISTLTAGTHSITAIYSGDGSFNTSTSTAISQVVTKANSAVSLASDTNPANPAQTITFTATITTTPAGSPATGNVTFRDGAAAIAACSAQTVTGNVATCAISTLASGTHLITAVYNGDTNLNSSAASNTVTQVVKATPTVAITASQPGAPGTPVQFAVTVTGTVVAPSGTVSIAVVGNPTVIATCVLTPAGNVGSCPASATVAAGSTSFVASYPGDASYGPASGNSAPLTVQLVPGPGTAAVIDGGPASGRVLVVAGDSQSTSIYDPATSKTAAGPALSVARSSPTATAIGNGQILIAGGNHSGGSTFELCTASACSAVGSLSTQRCNAAAALAAPGRVLIAGGDNCSGTALASWDLWSADGVVSSTASNSLSEARASLTATMVADGTVLLAGGGSKTAELFKLEGLSVTKLPSMLAARTGHTATLLPSGSRACASGSCVFLAGGVSGGATWEAFDIAANSFGRPANAMELLNPSRAWQAAALLADGRVLIAGGIAGNQSIETSETFDGARFASGPSLQTARSGAASAWLPSLDLLLMAGGSESPELLTAP